MIFGRGLAWPVTWSRTLVTAEVQAVMLVLAVPEGESVEEVDSNEARRKPIPGPDTGGAGI